MSHTRPGIHLQLKMVASIALLVGLLSLVVLSWMLFHLAPHGQASYYDAIASTSLTGAYLLPAMVAAGLVIVAVTALVTWLIALYSSFRVAGPLYRLARNLEDALARGPISAVPIRHSDKLQREAQRLEQAVDALHTHYGELRLAIAAAEDALHKRDDRAYAAALAALQQIEHRARL